jgi:two-component system, OmpR family, KDP operon response regulator KdpE
MSKAKCILIVDDDTELLQGLGMRLISAGYQVLVASDAPRALSASAAMQPDLILLDLGLRGEDGMTVLSHLRSTEATREVPVLVISARDVSWEGPVLAAGATGFFQKPVDNCEFLEAVALAVDDPREPIEH